MFMSSLDSYALSAVRRIEIRERRVSRDGRHMWRARVEPEIPGDVTVDGLPTADTWLTARFQGESVDSIAEWPLFVYVFQPQDELADDPFMGAHIVGWAEIYRTESDAESNHFG